MLLAFLLLASAGMSVADLNEAGKAAYMRGDFAGAERLFREALDLDPRDALLHYHRAVALTRLGRLAEASKAYRTALGLRPTPAVAAAAREALARLEPATRPARRPPDDDSLIRLRRVHGNWVAVVTVNDTRTARFLVDTGASVCVISPALAAELGIRPDPDAERVRLGTLGGPTSGWPVRIPSLRVGDAEASDVAAVIHETGPAFDGILGNTFLGRFTVTLDPAKGVLRLGEK